MIKKSLVSLGFSVGAAFAFSGGITTANAQDAADGKARYGSHFSRIVTARLRDTTVRGDPYVALGRCRPCCVSR